MIAQNDIARAIKKDLSAAEIRALIAQMISDQKARITPRNWILNNKNRILRWAMPDYSEFIYSWVKSKSGVEPHATDGQNELDAMVTRAVQIYQKLQSLEDA